MSGEHKTERMICGGCVGTTGERLLHESVVRVRDMCGSR